MTDGAILAAAAPHLAQRDALIPTIRGRDDIVAFARAVLAGADAARWDPAANDDTSLDTSEREALEHVR